jgi:purine nucleosidase
MSFFSKIKLYIKKIAIYFLIISTLGSIIYTYSRYRAKVKKIEFSAIIDADSGIGVSDLFVITRALADPVIEVVGLTSVQWNQNPMITGGTVGISQEINDTLLKLFGMENIPHPRGAEKMIDNWDIPIYEYSEAAAFIVKKANEASEKKKLNIITLGALTNLAAAILIDSTIVPKIRVYSSVMLYNTETKVWNKNEFNARNDLDALDLVLNTRKLEIHIMPVSLSKTFELDASETSDIMRNKGGQWDFIINNWQEKSLINTGPLNWNVAVIEAILKPDDVKEMQTTTPPENLSRQVYVYTWINKEFMKIDFHEIIKKYISDHRNQ